MFTILTRVAPSSIHGLGVFAEEDVPKGDIVWRFLPPFDRAFDENELVGAPAAVARHLDMYAYRSADLQGKLVLSGDNAKFLNHQDDPNTYERHMVSIANRTIDRGEEITCNYGSFCTDWVGFENEVPRLPHENVVTRLGVSKNGVGVFAIADIPAGTPLFRADASPIVRVPMDVVRDLVREQDRQLYIDFCPVRDGSFIAPPSFDQLTVGWYLNHSDQPNVASDQNLRFSTIRLVISGEELTADYVAYSEHASEFTRGWSKS